MGFWDLFEEMEAEMNRMRKRYDRVFNTLGRGFRQPLCDVRETDEKLIADIELPGVEKKDIEINVSEDELEIKCESKKKEEKKEEDYFRLERGYSGFYRRFTLPAKVKPEQTEAELEDGVLTVEMPKIKVKKPEKKKVKVKVE